MKKVFILFLFAFVSNLVVAQSNPIPVLPDEPANQENLVQTVIDSGDQDGTEVPLANQILNNNLSAAIPGIHDAFTENPLVLANAIVKNTTLADVLRLYMSTTDVAVKSSQEQILLGLYN